MREIKFRGKRVDDGEWFYGCLSYVDSRSQKIGSDFGSSFICQVQHSWQKTDSGYNIGWWIQVETKTVGQFTGLHDKNGVEIYEGDICIVSLSYFKIKNEKATVIFRNGSFQFQYGCEQFFSKTHDSWDEVEVIGNIHEVEEDET